MLSRLTLFALLGALCGTATAQLNTTDPNFWIADGAVRAIAEDATHYYIGGLFSYVGPYTGFGVPLDATTGTRSAVFPAVNNQVTAVVPDGTGGWYIGGIFTQVGGVARNRLAHILADGSVDPVWNPNANGQVRTLAVSGSTVYIGGDFNGANSINGTLTRNRLAAVDATTGIATAWDPNANNAVRTLAVSGSTVYVGGFFSGANSINGSLTRNFLAAVNATTGTATAWDPNANNAVRTLAVSGSTVYIGGDFNGANSINGTLTRNRLAAVDATTGTATAWDPNAGGPVNILAVSGSTVYIGGEFFGANVINGSLTRNRLAAVDATTGTATAWDPNANSAVTALAVSGSTVYIGGAFSGANAINGTLTRRCLAAVDATTGTATAWDPIAGGPVGTLAVSGSTVYAGGNFSSVNGYARTRLAKISKATGAADPVWDPNANGQVNTLAVSGSTVYIGGSFNGANAINGSLTRNRLAAVDATTGIATTWDPNANTSVNTLAVAGSTVYIGGTFSGVNSINGSLTRNYLAAVDATTGTANAWNPRANFPVNALVVSGSTVYIGGNFNGANSINGSLTRNRLAAVDATTGTATAWNPNASNSVFTLAVLGSTVYIGGAFIGANAINGSLTRNHLAAVDATTGTATTWDPNANGQVLTLAVSGSTVYIGGFFSGANSINGSLTRNLLASVDATTGIATAWDPNVNGQVNALAVSGSTVLAGGAFTTVGGLSQQRLAYFGPAVAFPVEYVGFTATATPARTVQINWTTATERNASHFVVEMAPASAETTGHSTQAFAEVGTVAATGTTSTERNYTFETGTLAPGLHQFRLRQHDLDDAYTHSPTVEVFIGADAETAFTLYPNPLNGNTLHLTGLNTTTGTVQIVDAAGRTVHQQPLSATLTLPDALPNGLNTVLVTTPEGRAIQRVLIAR